MNEFERQRYFWVISSALIQGILLGVYAVIKSGALLYMPLTIIIIIPFVLWLTQEYWGRRLNNFLAGLFVVLLIFYLYRLWSLYSPSGSFYVVPSQKSDLIRISIAIFLLIPFFQCRIATWSWEIPYSEIFFQLCRNLFLLFQAGIVIAVFWGLLVTAGLLFDIVGLEIIPYIIFNPLMAVPLTSLIIAISISVAIKHPGIDSLGRWLLSVLAWLLPFFSVLSVGFILCLPFSGLKALWDTGQASTLMLLLQFGTIILANAAWLDGTKSNLKNNYINLISQISLLCLPIYFAMCLYSVGLRIQQYGLSVDRIQAMFMVVITGIWGLSYAFAVLLRKWPVSIGRVNMYSVLIMSVIVAVMNSPILDPYKLAAHDQAWRLKAGKISPGKFDYVYARFNLGRYGNEILNDLKKSDDEIIKSGANEALNVEPLEYWNYIDSGILPVKKRQEIINNARVYPENKNLNKNMTSFILSEWDKKKSIFKNVKESDDIAFLFLKVASDDENLIILLENTGLILSVQDKIFIAGIFYGRFTPQEFLLNKPEAIEPEFKNIISGKNIYQVVRLN